ncbi:unnamed protein product [Tuber melanosporum]|uniref:(Perigord truffle) hypothetical protein n=1 Tax=Tuber melanosporum (strain Mel28) TaxID=656061 RepID=D5G9E4_TUBMM|nr:uncharacterized protein GSTUM_00003270001 [Tuber melanosporum]CAZ81137.1 unnamed protein product [Tuber melanosporum]
MRRRRGGGAMVVDRFFKLRVVLLFGYFILHGGDRAPPYRPLAIIWFFFQRPPVLGLSFLDGG